MSEMKLIEETIQSMLSDVVRSMAVAPGIIMFPDETVKAFEDSTGFEAPAESIDVLTLEFKTMEGGKPIRLFLLPREATVIAMAAIEWVEALHDVGKCGGDHG